MEEDRRERDEDGGKQEGKRGGWRRFDGKRRVWRKYNVCMQVACVD